MSIYENLISTIGNTPLVKLNRLMAHYELKANLLAKVESFNPSNSVKDRAALYMIKAGREAGLINDNTHIIEPTSGNTGIGLAMICASLGLKLTLTLPSSMSVERRSMLAAYGANLVLTDAGAGMKGAIAKAEELHAADPNSFIPNQFENLANPKAHYETTGPEIYRDTGGQVAAFVAGVGTGGTLIGAGKYLKEKIPSLQLCALEPATSAILSGNPAGKHGIQGLGAGFLRGIVAPDRSLIDRSFKIEDKDALANGRLACRTEGLFCGISAGAALTAAIALAKEEQFAGKNIVVVIPDSGDRYLSTALYKVD